MDYLATHISLLPIRRGSAPGFVNYKKGCTRLATASDTVYQLFAHGRWYSPGTPASPTTKSGRHDIAEILLKVAFNTKNHKIKIKSNHRSLVLCVCIVDYCLSFFLLAIVLSVLRFTDSDCPFGIFKLFLSFVPFVSI